MEKKMDKKFDVSLMPPLSGDLRELVLFYVQDIQARIAKIEELLCLSDEEEDDE